MAIEFQITVPPLLPSAAWWNNFLKNYASTGDPHSAIAFANTYASGKDFSRYCLSDNHGQVHPLSLAVEGGGRFLRNPRNITLARISEHGEWRKNHLGAWEACLGRKPFFRHIAEPLEKLLLNREIKELKDLNSAIFKEIFAFLIGNLTPEELTNLFSDATLQARGKEIANSINSEVSVLEASALYGKEALLGIACIS